MPSLHLKGTSCLLAVAFMFGIAGNASAATSPVTLSDLSTDLRLLVLGLKYCLLYTSPSPLDD